MAITGFCKARWFRYMCIAVIPLFVLPLFVILSDGAVNVFLATGVPIAIQSDLLQGLTNQWNGTLTQSKFDPTSYSFTVANKKPLIVPPPTTPPQTGGECSIDQSSWSFVNGFGAAQDYTTCSDLRTISKYEVLYASCTSCLQPAFTDIFITAVTSPTQLNLP